MAAIGAGVSALLSVEGRAALRTAWLALFASAALAATAGWATHAYRAAEDQSLATTRKLLSQAEARLSGAQRERAGIDKWLASHRALADRGVLGTENRLGLVEHLRRLKPALRLATLDFDLEPQRDVSVAGLTTPTLSLLASRLTLTLRAPHEGHALAFLTAATAAPQGLLLAQSCSFRQTPDAPPAPTVEATCTVEWLTVRPREAGRHAP